MGRFTFRKQIKLPLGFRLNVNKRGASLSQKVGRITATHRWGRRARVTVNLPGPLGYTTGGEKTSKSRRPRSTPRSERERIERPEMPEGGFNPYR